MSARGQAAPSSRRRPFGGALLAAALLGAAAAASGPDDVASHPECASCGMDRKAYGYSRMLIRYQDGGETGACSLHCAVIELEADPARATRALLVADRDTRELVEVEAAVWVLGGGKRAVMAARPKWAFATAGAAEAFVRAHGGEIVGWGQALAAAREDVAAERRLRLARANRSFGCLSVSGQSR